MESSWTNNSWLGVSPSIEKNVWKSPSVNSPNPIMKPLSPPAIDESPAIPVNDDLLPKLNLTGSLEVTESTDDLDNVWAEIPSKAPPIVDENSNIETGLGLQKQEEVQDVEENKEDSNKAIATLTDETVITEESSPSEEIVEEANLESESNDEDEDEDDFGDFEDTPEPKLSKQNEAESIFKTSPQKLIEAVYANQLKKPIEDKPTKNLEISSLLDYGEKTRKLYNSFSRPNRQFHFPGKSAGGDDGIIVRWNGSEIESQLLKVLKKWDSQERGISNKEETEIKGKDAYAAMFGWSSSKTDVENNKKIKDELLSPTIKNLTMKENLTRRAAKLADKLVEERHKKEFIEREKKERQKEIDKIKSEKLKKAAALKKLNQEKTFNEKEAESENEQMSSPSTRSSGIFSPLNSIFGFQKQQTVKLPTKISRQIRKSNVSSKDYFERNSISESVDKNREEIIEEDEDDGFGDFVFKTSNSSDLDEEDDEEEEDSSVYAGYGNIGDAVDLAFEDEPIDNKDTDSKSTVIKETKEGKKMVEKIESVSMDEKKRIYVKPVEAKAPVEKSIEPIVLKPTQVPTNQPLIESKVLKPNTNKRSSIITPINLTENKVELKTTPDNNGNIIINNLIIPTNEEDDDDDFGDFASPVDSLSRANSTSSSVISKSNNTTPMNINNSLLINSKLNEIKMKSNEQILSTKMIPLVPTRSRSGSLKINNNVSIIEGRGTKLNHSNQPSLSSPHSILTPLESSSVKRKEIEEDDDFGDFTDAVIPTSQSPVEGVIKPVKKLTEEEKIKNLVEMVPNVDFMLE